MPGYEPLTAAAVGRYLPEELMERRMCCLTEVDSTNTYLKKEALLGAPGGTVVTADRQTAGRGRRGRSFLSPAGRGLYLSMLLRPQCPPDGLMAVTGMAAVAVCRAVERAGGAKAQVKWVNDLVLNGKKLCGILAEAVMTEQGMALVLGVGVNVDHRREDFSPEVADMATSLAMEGFDVSRAALAAAVIEELAELERALGGEVSGWVEAYRLRCANLGRDVQLLWREGCRQARALDVDERFGLVVQYPDGVRETVRTGEVSVRGLYGYVE